MVPQLYISDTSTDADEVQFAALRKLSPLQRFRKACALSSQVRQMAIETIRRRNPGLDDNGLQLRFLEHAYGKELADEIANWKARQGG